MLLLRIVIIFVFAAFSMARAACGKFEIFAEGTFEYGTIRYLEKDGKVSIGCNGVPSSIKVYKEPFTLSVNPEDEEANWQFNTTPSVGIIASSCSPSYTLGGSIGVTVESNSATKTINITFGAIPDFTATLNDPKGTSTSQTIPLGGKITKPANPTASGYTFEYWEYNSKEYNFDTPVVENITLTAKWKLVTYNITYSLSGGTCADCPKTYTVESAEITLPTTPTRNGYTFNGWSATATIPSGSTGDKSFTAQWQVIVYNITYNLNGSTCDNCPPTYTVENSITLPDPKERCGYVFSGWLPAKIIPIGSTGDKTYTAGWTNSPKTPTIDLFDYDVPYDKQYDGNPIGAATATPKPANECIMGAVSILYEDSNTPPKDAGTYQIYASVEANTNYAAAKVRLGSVTISKADASFDIVVVVNNKRYDGTTAAVIKSIDFTTVTGLYEFYTPTTSDYSVEANFVSIDVGTGIDVNGTLNWLQTGTLYKNYNLPSIDFSAKANILQATGVLKIKAPQNYELSNPIKPSVSQTNTFIKDSDITWEYKMEESEDYSENLPNRIGNWSVRASFPTTPNYTGATDYADFLVTRGSATTVIHEIAFEDADIVKDDELSSGLTKYYVVGASLCKVPDINFYVTVSEPDIVLRVGNEKPNMQPDANGFDRYEIPFSPGKPGLDTLIYTLLSNDDIYSEQDTLLIETPLPFETVVKQKWNNVLLINNNPKTNDGYEFTDFKWFKNGTQIGEQQFYSAGPKSTDILSTKDVYKVTMHTSDGIRISTCEGNPEAEAGSSQAKPALTKQVLGVNGKTAKTASKIYNLNGKQIKETPAGVYVVEE